MAERMIFMGGPEPLTSGSRPKRCAKCGRLAYFSPAAFKRIADEKLTVDFWCVPCGLTLPETEIAPFSPAQMAEIHAAGVDLTGEQVLDFTKRTFRRLRGR